MMSLRMTCMAGLLALAAGCGDFLAAPDPNIAGTYTLRSVNGSSLPATTEQTSTRRTEVVDDTYNLFQGGTFAQVTHVRVTVGGATTSETRNDTGTWVPNQGALNLKSNGTGVTVVAAMADGNMTVQAVGVSYVYRKI